MSVIYNEITANDAGPDIIRSHFLMMGIKTKIQYEAEH